VPHIVYSLPSEKKKEGREKVNMCWIIGKGFPLFFFFLYKACIIKNDTLVQPKFQVTKLSGVPVICCDFLGQPNYYSDCAVRKVLDIVDKFLFF